MNITFRKVSDKDNYERIIKYLNIIKEGLNIDTEKNILIPTVELTGEPSDFRVLTERLLLLSRMSSHLAIMQGAALELQKSYKHPIFYGLYEKTSELNRTVRMEVDVLRSVISTEKELIKLK